ncbi:MAG: hypothetical protein P8M68_05745 [Aquiluna sp.]|nr:hypothetical protein [Aquiluna sp.]
MRFWIALSVFVTGLVFSAVGFVNQIENQPIDVINASGSLSEPASYVLIPNSVLSAYDGESSVFAIGDGQVFMATGRESDIVAWLGDSQYVELRISVNVKDETVGLAEILRPGTGPLVDPAGADIWQSELANNGTLLLPFEITNEVAILMASTGADLAPRTVRIGWDLGDVVAPVAPITLIGLGITILGALMGIYASFVYSKKYRRRRKGRGPKLPKPIRMKNGLSQAGNRPPTGRRAHRPMGFIAATASLSLLSGCVPNYENPIISPQALEQPGVLTASMTETQLSKILKDIARVISVADSELDRESLEVRVAGPALEMRKAAYALAAKTDASDDGPTPIVAGPIQLFLPSATDTWPRSALVITGQTALQALVLMQESPRDGYKLYQYADLLPGIQFPDVPAATVGANLFKEDNRFLSMDPASIVEGLGNLLNVGANSPWSLLIDPDNTYVADVSSVQFGLQQTLSNANLSFNHLIAENPPVILANSDGGALVALYMIDTYTIIPKEPGDAVAITGDEATLLGTGGSATGIETQYGAMLLFNVPASGSDDRVTLLGATQQLLSAITLGG